MPLSFYFVVKFSSKRQQYLESDSLVGLCRISTCLGTEHKKKCFISSKHLLFPNQINTCGFYSHCNASTLTAPLRKKEMDGKEKKNYCVQIHTGALRNARRCRFSYVKTSNLMRVTLLCASQLLLRTTTLNLT